MSSIDVESRKLIVKAGMTVDDIRNSKVATTLQKKYASAFDTDGKKGFSQEEANLFNATTFAEKKDGSVIFWTRQKDGNKIGTKFNANSKEIKYTIKNDVKPYFTSTVKTEKRNSENFFYAVAGLPISKVDKYKNATSLQKEFAKAFDTNKNGIFDQKEADLFNATTFSKKSNNKVIFYTNVAGKKLFGPSQEKVATVFEGNLDNIKFDNKNQNLKNRTIIPSKETHHKLISSNRSVCPNEEYAEGLYLHLNTANSYSEIYYKGAYMNSVTLRDGTVVIYPKDTKNGSVELHNQGGSDSSIGYSYSTGYDINSGRITLGGEGGYKVTTKNSDDDYYVSFKNLKNSFIIGSNIHNRYELKNCENCVVDHSIKDETPDNTYIQGGKNNTVIQGNNDVTRVYFNKFDVLSKGKKSINTRKLEDDCKNVKYESQGWFKGYKWTGIKNHDVEYVNDHLREGIRYWF